MWQRFIRSKLATLVLIGILGLVMFGTAKILVQKRTIDREIAKLEAQMEKVKKDNNQLSSLIQYLNTPEYQEKSAREKLNLRKDGEQVVVLPAGQDAGTVTEQQPEPPKPNYQEWFDYFFNNK